MTSFQGRGRLRHERSSVVSSVALFLAPLDSFPPPEMGDELFDQPTAPSGAKLPVTNALAATSIPMYFEDDLQRIFKAVLEARAPVPALAPVPAPVPILAPALAPALIVAKAHQKKLKTCFPDVYRGKSHMDCYNFCQQGEDYFATIAATGPTRILFATSFLQDWISFRW